MWPHASSPSCWTDIRPRRTRRRRRPPATKPVASAARGSPWLTPELLGADVVDTHYGLPCLTQRMYRERPASNKRDLREFGAAVSSAVRVKFRTTALPSGFRERCVDAHVLTYADDRVLAETGVASGIRKRLWPDTAAADVDSSADAPPPPKRPRRGAARVGGVCSAPPTTAALSASRRLRIAANAAGRTQRRRPCVTSCSRWRRRKTLIG
jgi:hypothetical protein